MLDADKRPERSDGPRAGFEDTIWFRMDVGRKQNADARWILPLLCRRGHITKAEIGAIRITGDETLFEIPRAAADRFAAALKRTQGDDPETEDGIRIVAVEGKPREAARQNRRESPAPDRAKLGAKFGARPTYSDGPSRPSGDRGRPSGDRGRPGGDRGRPAGARPGSVRPGGDRSGGPRPFKGKPKGRP
jgi:ATP-dependent RNA helicase DeaD